MKFRALKPILLTFVGTMALGTWGATAQAGWTTASSRIIKSKKRIPNAPTRLYVSGACNKYKTSNGVALQLSNIARLKCKRYKGSIAVRAHYKVLRMNRIGSRCLATLKITRQGYCQIDKMIGYGWMLAATGGIHRGRKDANTIAYCKRYKTKIMRTHAIRFSKSKVFKYCRGKKYWRPVSTRITSRTRNWKNYSRSRQHFVCSAQFYMSFSCHKAPLLY